MTGIPPTDPYPPADFDDQYAETPHTVDSDREPNTDDFTPAWVDEVFDLLQQGLDAARQKSLRAAEISGDSVQLESLAEFLHEKFCSWNHTDGCTWFYEKSWNEYAHQEWIENAKAVRQWINFSSKLPED